MPIEGSVRKLEVDQWRMESLRCRAFALADSSCVDQISYNGTQRCIGFTEAVFPAGKHPRRVRITVILRVSIQRYGRERLAVFSLEELGDES